MDLIQLLVLALIQGLTEFLPISSSAHLIIPSTFFDWPDQGLAFDIAVHIGSLLAVVIYFRSDLQLLVEDSFASIIDRKFHTQTHLAIQIIVATLPIALVGFLIKPMVESTFRTVEIIAGATIVFGVLMGVADQYSKRRAIPAKHLPGYYGATLIGLAQILALIPGTSRSGITITTAIFVGLTYQNAARFSFLISIPVITGAGLLAFYDAMQTPITVEWNGLIMGALISGLSAFICIGVFIRLINWTGLMPYVYYRLTLGFLILIAL